MKEAVKKHLWLAGVAVFAILISGALGHGDYFGVRPAFGYGGGTATYLIDQLNQNNNSANVVNSGSANHTEVLSKPENKESEKPAFLTAAQKAEKAFRQWMAQVANESTLIVTKTVDEFLALIGLKKDPATELTFSEKLKQVFKGIENLSAQAQASLNNFVNFGTPATSWLGAGERAGVVNSFRSAFGNLPQSEADWAEVIKIANGRWPEYKSDSAEVRAVSTFKTVYRREPDRTNPRDDAAVMVFAYGLRPTQRNLESEANAIKSFKDIWKKDPVLAGDWDAVRSIAYSGATR